MSTQDAILKVLAKHAKCDVAKLTPAAVLADIGINSLKFIMVGLEIEQATGKKILDINKVGKLKTVGDILALAEGTKP
jgi:acyl carrier protein